MYISEKPLVECCGIWCIKKGQKLIPPIPVNDFRTARVSEVLFDFKNIQYFIAAAPVEPDDMDDYFTEGWAALRQCNLDGQNILNCGADTNVPVASGGPEEQAKAELRQLVLFGRGIL